MQYANIIHDYILIAILLALTGFMSFFGWSHGLFFFMPYILLLFYRRNCHLSKQTRWVLFGLSILILLQMRVHHGTLISSIPFWIRLLLMAMSAIILAPRFSKTFPQTMYVICLVSLFLWLIFLIPPIRSLFISLAQYLPEFRSEEFLARSTNDSYSIYIYTISKNHIRNSGPFFEPGMFTVFITLALAMRMFNNKRLLTLPTIVLFITNLTTFSTTGYVAMIVLLLGYVFGGKLKKWQKYLAIIIMAIVLPQILSLDFMQEKIEEEIAAAAYDPGSRVGALLYHWEKIRLAPFLGYGINKLPLTDSDTLFGGVEATIAPNGISYMAILFGIPGAILYFVFIFLSSRILICKSSKLQQLVMMTVILALVFSQDVTGRLFFFLLFFMGVESLNNKYNVTNEENRNTLLLPVS